MLKKSLFGAFAKTVKKVEKFKEVQKTNWIDVRMKGVNYPRLRNPLLRKPSALTFAFSLPRGATCPHYYFVSTLASSLADNHILFGFHPLWEFSPKKLKIEKSYEN